MNRARRAHPLSILPLAILLAAMTWHLVFYNHYNGSLPPPAHLVLMAFAALITGAALFFRGSKKIISSYLEGLLDPLRLHMVGLACVMLGILHFIGTLNQGQIYLKLAYMVLLLAFLETSSMATGFHRHYSRGMTDVTRATVQRLLANLAGRLGMVLALSLVMLYLSLMVIVGFTGPFSVAFMGAVMMLAIVFITLVRRH